MQAEQVGTVKLRADPEVIALLITSVPPGIAAVRPDLSDTEREQLSLLWVNMIRAVLDSDSDVWVDYQ